MINLAATVAKISLGKLCPSMQLHATTIVGVNREDPAVNITIEVADADEQEYVLGLAQLHRVPFALLEGVDERPLVAWILERCQDVIMHEVAEFFRYDGARFAPPTHPLTEKTYAHRR
jgi:hypothetical protein